MKTNRAFLGGSLLAALLLVHCEYTAVAPEDGKDGRPLTVLEKQVVESGNRFGLKLFRTVVDEKTGENVFISPLSVAMALGMTLNGAAGDTKAAMESTLELAGLTTDEINRSYQSVMELLVDLDPKVQFEIANSIWYRQELQFEQKFIDVNKQYFDALVQGLDFDAPNAKDIINGWVKENTHGRIEDIVDEINRDHVMFLIDAIYFKGQWLYRFDSTKTKDDTFTRFDGTTQQSQMMQMQAKILYFTNDLFQAADLPYGGAGFSMTILLPKTDVALQDLVAACTPENWATWIAGLDSQTVVLTMPKFTARFETSLKDALATLGMGVAFGGRADFTGMYKPGGLFISEVKHKTFVQVDEEGTEAAAVTSVEISRTSFPSEPQAIFMRVDRPFLYVIREHHSETILFIGVMGAPES